MRQKKFPEWFALDFKVLTDFVNKGEVQIVNERDYLIPFKQTFGGRFGHVDLQSGDYGRGSSPTGADLRQSFYTLRMNFEFDELQIAATENKGVAIQNPFVYCLANGVREFEFLFDKVIHGNGTAALATATVHSSSSGVSVYTMDSKFGTQLLRRGQVYCIYDSNLATLKSSNLVVTAINTTSRTVTLSGIVPSAASTDVFCFEGVSGASPTGPRGVQYWINTATSGNTAGIDRSVENQIVAKSADGTNGFNVEVVMALYDRILMDRGEVPDVMGVCSPAQRAYAFNQMVALQETFLNSGNANAIDRLPKLKGREFFMWGGIPHYVDIHQDKTTNVYIVPSDFGRARLRTPGFTQLPGVSGEAGRFFRPSGASGGPAASVWFGLQRSDDLYCINPGQQGLITSLPVASDH
jgi:hypothetical protein